MVRLLRLLVCLTPAMVAMPLWAQEDSVAVRAVPYFAAVRPGEEIPIAVVLDYPRGWHSWPREPVVPPDFAGVNAIPTTVELLAGSGAEAGIIQWPDTQRVMVRYTRRPVPLTVYAGRAVAFVTTRFTGRAGDAVSVRLAVQYQPCDETTCFAPRIDTLAVAVRLNPVPAKRVPAEPTLFEAYRGRRPSP